MNMTFKQLVLPWGRDPATCRTQLPTQCGVNIRWASLICPRRLTAEVWYYYNQTSCARIGTAPGHQSQFNLRRRTQLSLVVAITNSSTQWDLTSSVRWLKQEYFERLSRQSDERSRSVITWPKPHKCSWNTYMDKMRCYFRLIHRHVSSSFLAMNFKVKLTWEMMMFP